MTLLHPSASSEIHKVGSVINSNAAPNDDWVLCKGQILAQADYPEYVAAAQDLHPYRYETFNVYDSVISSGDEFYDSGNNGSYVLAVGTGVYLKTSNGTSFTYGAMPSGSTTYIGLAWNGSVWCANGGYGTTAAATSSDGESWTARTLPASYNWLNVVWDGTYFILVAGNNTQTYRSTDGINWNTAGTLPTTSTDWVATIGNGVTIVWDQTFYYLTEDSGSTWTTYFAPALYENYFLASANGIFIKCIQQYPRYSHFVEYSLDGKEWLQKPFHLMAQYEYIYLSAYDWVYADDGWYYGLPYNYGWGIKSPDLKVFYPWYVYMATMHSFTKFEAINDKLVIFPEYSGSGTNYVADFTPYDSSTYFQLPRYDYMDRANIGQRQYIKVK